MRLRPILLPTSTLLACLSIMITSTNAQWYQGPSGSSGGQAYDGWILNQKKTNISGVLVISNKSTRLIQCIIAEYRGSGVDGPANCNSANPADSYALFAMDPDEYVLGIGGTYTDHITSLRLYTNKKNSPVYGEGGSGQVFGYTAPQGQMIVSFQQNLDTRLHSIGVMYAPCDRTTKACR